MILDLFGIAYFDDGCYDRRKQFHNHISDESLIKVLIEFGDEAFTKDSSILFPDYDRLEEFISNEINKKHGNNLQFPPMFSWLSDEEKLKAKMEMEENPMPNIRTEIKFQ